MPGSDTTIKDNLCKAQPRSLVSMTKECSDGVTGCKVSLVEVDGRSAAWSVGITLDNIVTFLVGTLKADSAVNLDGGGSATMYVRTTGAWCLTMLATGCLVSNVANNNGSERAVTNAVVLLPGIDPKEPHPSGG
jgi:exopolysaccharide biosynthesis protein